MLSVKVSEGRDPVLAPVASEDRVATLDILRGFALFGVMLSNLFFWYVYFNPVSLLDRSFDWFMGHLVMDRFYSLLGFLFGIGFAIQLQRAEVKGSDGRNIFLRRMLALLAFGMVHGLLIWWGDILTDYALLGFLLVFYRRLSQRRLAVTTALTYFLVPYIYAQDSRRSDRPTDIRLAPKLVPECYQEPRLPLRTR